MSEPDARAQSSEETPEPVEQVADALRSQQGLSQVTGENFSVQEAVGGWRGVLEAVLPWLVFVVAFVITNSLTVPLVASLGVALTLTAIRLIQRSPVTQAVAGLLGVLISAVWAWRSGEPGDFFQWGLWVNGAYALVTLVSIIAGWPVIGVFVELLRGRGFAWRNDPELAPLRRRYTWASWVWLAVFVVRLAVQVPLFLADEVAALGIARIVMGLPLFGLAAYFTWALVRQRPEDPPPESDEPR